MLHIFTFNLKYGNTALALASYLGYTKVVELLLSCPGIAVNLLDQVLIHV